jgi:hypothetical protein
VAADGAEMKKLFCGAGMVFDQKCIIQAWSTVMDWLVMGMVHGIGQY